jgi:hypothetical protein
MLSLCLADAHEGLDGGVHNFAHPYQSFLLKSLSNNRYSDRGIQAQLRFICRQINSAAVQPPVRKCERTPLPALLVIIAKVRVAIELGV